MPTHRYAEEGRALGRESRPQTRVHGSVGFLGYFAGPSVHIVDYYGLADPLLARLPALHTRNWRIGHFWRAIPAGYEESAGTTRNRIQDPGLARYYDRLRLVVSGPVFSRERWGAILELNLGLLDHLIQRLRYRYPTLRVVTLARLSAPGASLASGPEPDRAALSADGLLVLLGAVRSDRGLAIEATSGESFEVLFLLDGTATGRAVAQGAAGGPGAFSRIDVRTPDGASKKGYDALHILPLGEPNRASVRRVVLPG
jgi:arabinofuranosyltransferase